MQAVRRLVQAVEEEEEEEELHSAERGRGHVL